MALIPCPACERQISEMAPACPGCGHPVASTRAAPQAMPASPAFVQTIEQTSKTYKAMQLIGIAMILSSFVACSLDSPGAGWLLILLGFLVHLAARMGAWWNNG